MNDNKFNNHLDFTYNIQKAHTQNQTQETTLNLQQLQKSVNHDHLQKLTKSLASFEDYSFPPNLNSLIGEYDSQYRFRNIQWKRITSLIVNPKIITGKIQPSDIKQGLIGDCYFLAAIASLAQRPQRIKKLFFNQQQISPNKHFQVKMLYQGKWVKIDLDEWFPTYKGRQLAFTKAVHGQLWAVILEKAWAKLYSSYMRIQGGFPQQTLHDLTGAPCKTLMLNKYVKQETWQYLWHSSLRQYSMVAASNNGRDTDLSYAGIAQGHAYTLLSATEIRIEDRFEKVVKLRNPWGQTQSRISLSDTDPIWNKISQQEKQRVGYYERSNKKDYNDGIFFMYYEDFVNQFVWVQVAQVQDKASYIYLSTRDPGLKGVYYHLTIYKKGIYSLQVDKPPMRGYPQKIQRFYSYPLAQITIKYSDSGRTVYNSKRVNNRRTEYIKQQLNPGVYLIKVLIDYDRKLENNYHVNLAIYSQNKCALKWATKQQAEEIQEKKVQWKGEVSQKKEDWYNGGNTEYLKNISKWKFISDQ